MNFTKKFLFILFLIILAGIFSTKNSNAASLSSVKDTITTSRPSASAPIDANAPNGATSVNFYDNGTRFIASDSAKLIGGPGSLEVVTVATMSASSGSPAKRTLYFATGIGSSHNDGTVVMTPVTAKHTVSFQTTTAVPSNGLIKITFPVGDTTNTASPSASGFSFNNLNTTKVSNITITGATCSSWTVTAATGLVQCSLNVGLTGPTSISIGIGTSVPELINPTKSSSIGGTANVWTVTVQTTDNGGVTIDSSRIKIATIESVDVYATVDSTFTFTISGIGATAATNIGNSACGNTEASNTGFDSSATEVNLGLLGSGQINHIAQLMLISTNGVGGYALTATSSGHLIAPDIGYWILDAQGTPTNNDTPVPAFLTVGTPAFGIHPCGLDVTGATWGTGATGGGTGAKYAHPSATYYYTLASDTSGPIVNTSPPGNGMVTVEYAATISSAVPAGTYRTNLTYVATPTF